MIYDTYTGKCLLFGGHLTASDGRDLGYENEVWAYDYAADDWQRITTTTKPPARYWHDLAYDPEGNNIILFSGSQGGGTDLGDTWVYSCREAKWTQVTSMVSPPARSQPSMAYDTETKSTIMFGGADFVSQGDFNYYNDVWALGADNQWEQLTTSEQTSPTGQTSSGVPGFGILEVSAGVCLGVAVLLLFRRRASMGVSAP
jgi:N-acetylneuraminic acid mutarotase